MKPFTRHWNGALAALALAMMPAIGSSASSQTPAKPATPPAATAAPAVPAATQDIVDIAVGNKDLSTLVAALKAAGLVDTLKGKGPFTVFAPTDEAFKKLPAGVLDDLLKPESKAKLASVLKFHVLPGAYDAARITKAKSKQYALKTVQGASANIDLRKGVLVAGANVSKTDIKASNGVIHVVDSVMLPPSIKAALRAADLKAKAAAKAVELKAKAAEAAAAAKLKATELKDKAKAAVTPAPSAPAGTPPAKKP
jgi:uncharacterized surface protein with fasciclin (FAS1) repeats